MNHSFLYIIQYVNIVIIMTGFLICQYLYINKAHWTNMETGVLHLDYSKFDID